MLEPDSQNDPVCPRCAESLVGKPEKCPFCGLPGNRFGESFRVSVREAPRPGRHNYETILCRVSIVALTMSILLLAVTRLQIAMTRSMQGHIEKACDHIQAERFREAKQVLGDGLVISEQWYYRSGIRHLYAEYIRFLDGSIDIATLASATGLAYDNLDSAERELVTQGISLPPRHTTGLAALDQKLFESFGRHTGFSSEAAVNPD